MIAEPKLDRPGAGVPFPRNLVLRYVVGPFVANRSNPKESILRFRELTAKIDHEIQGLDEQQLRDRKLVPPMLGLEDSSRFWSVSMALEHLGIVGESVRSIIEGLEHNVIPGIEADTAKVKPAKETGASQAKERYEDFCRKSYPALVENYQGRAMGLRYKHPWFGPLNSNGWLWLLATHHRIHLRQIREIKKSLSEPLNHQRSTNLP